MPMEINEALDELHKAGLITEFTAAGIDTDQIITSFTPDSMTEYVHELANHNHDLTKTERFNLMRIIKMLKQIEAKGRLEALGLASVFKAAKSIQRQNGGSLVK